MTAAMSGDRLKARNALFPELEDRPDTYLERLQFSDDAWGSILRVAAAIAAERERVLAPVRALANRLDEDWEAVMVGHDHDECLGDIIRAVLPPADTEETRRG